MRAKGLILIAVLCICIVGILTSCTSSDDNTEVPTHPKSLTIQVSIQYGAAGNQPDIINQPFNINKSDTMLSLVQLYGSVTEMPVYIETTGSTIYGINNIINSDTHQWKCYLNGKEVAKLADVTLKKNGKVELKYEAR